MNFNKKNTGVAALKVLKKNGVEVEHAYPGCCGMPFLEQADLFVANSVCQILLVTELKFFYDKN